MRNYEVVFIVNPDLDETALTGVVDQVKAWITDAGGTVEKVDLWGKRRMAYLIRKQREGQYVLLTVCNSLPPLPPNSNAICGSWNPLCGS